MVSNSMKNKIYRILFLVVLGSLVATPGLSTDMETLQSVALSRDKASAIPAIQTLVRQRDAVTLLKVFQKSRLHSARLAALEGLQGAGGVAEARELVKSFSDLNSPPYEGGSEEAGSKIRLRDALIRTLAVLSDVVPPREVDQHTIHLFLEACRKKHATVDSKL